MVHAVEMQKHPAAWQYSLTIRRGAGIFYFEQGSLSENYRPLSWRNRLQWNGAYKRSEFYNNMSDIIFISSGTNTCVISHQRVIKKEKKGSRGSQMGAKRVPK